MKTFNLNSKALKIAHKIKAQFDNWSDALKAAWRIIKIQAGRPTHITFVKSSGEVRTAKAIALGSIETISRGFVKFVEALEGGSAQWRSFRLERLILD